MSMPLMLPWCCWTLPICVSNKALMHPSYEALMHPPNEAGVNFSAQQHTGTHAYIADTYLFMKTGGA